MRIAAILVSFDPAQNPFDAAVRLGGLVETPIVVDNSVAGNPELDRLSNASVILLRNNNRGGLAGAYNSALRWISSHQPHITHILFVDDDTDLDALQDFVSSPITIAAAESAGTAAVAPVYRERNTGLRGRHIKLGRFRFHYLAREHDGPTDVAFVINSMSLWRRDALVQLGPYSEVLGIDHIDTEYAMRAKRAGYRILLNTEAEFLHSIGKRCSYRLLGRTLQSGGHGPARRFLIGRNTALVAKKHGFAYPAFMALCLQRLAYETVGIVAVEDAKVAKLKGLWRGVLEGLWTRAD